MDLKKRLAWGGLLTVLLPLAVLGGLSKVAVVALVGFTVMLIGAVIGHRHGLNPRPELIATSYGLASGAMVASAALFLLPQALVGGSVAGSAGVAVGVIVGYGIHTYGHQLTHEVEYDPTIAELTIHSLTNGRLLEEFCEAHTQVLEGLVIKPPVRLPYLQDLSHHLNGATPPFLSRLTHTRRR